jgi:hypothetical protein
MTVSALFAYSFCLSPKAFGQTDPTAPTTVWVPILYGNNNYPDPSADQQTGSAESDILGNLNQPSLSMQYASGWLGFRLRVGADMNPPGFKGAAFVGVDADLNGSLDVFLGVNNQGSANQVGIWYPGTGLNTSPKTTTIITPPDFSYSGTALNYGFAPVTATIDPTATSFDLNGDGRTDQFLTFFVLFSDVASALASKGTTFSLSNPMQLVAATATQANSLNEDLNGVNGGINSSSSWQQLGAVSQLYLPNGIAPVPEPSTLAIAGAGGGLMSFHCFRARRRA